MLFLRARAVVAIVTVCLVFAAVLVVQQASALAEEPDCDCVVYVWGEEEVLELYGVMDTEINQCNVQECDLNETLLAAAAAW